MKALCVTLLSLSLTATVIGNAYYQKKQFYPSVVYITKSNPSMAVMYIQAFILVLLTGKLMRKVFFGQLRPAEFEHLMERSWYAITETCLAFTVFRDDFNPKFIALFTVLLFLKAFHWLAEDRVDYMERSPVIGRLFHLRILSLLTVLAHLDILFIMHAYESTVMLGASVQLVFGFEYAILIIMIVNITIKYVLHAVEARWEAPWESKAAVLLYTELAVSFLKVSLYVGFVAVMVRTYTLPLFAFRPMYYTMRSFKKAFNDVVLSRRAIRNMNTRYPDASAEELAAADNVCIICREEMHSGAKKLPCNHIFHAACLRSWFQRQQTCPTCRLNVLRAPRVAAPRAPAPAPAAPPRAPPAAPRRAAPQPPPPPANAVPQMMSGLAWPPPPPPPPPRPPSLGALTAAELARMEGVERRHTEARIQYLRDIQLLLDASVAMMQQYAALVGRLPTPTPRHAATQTEQVSEPEEVFCNASSILPMTEEEEFQAAMMASPPPIPSENDAPSTSAQSAPVEKEVPSHEESMAAKPGEDEDSAGSGAVKVRGGDTEIDDGLRSTSGTSSSSKEDVIAEDLRRRRLQKFTQEN